MPEILAPDTFAANLADMDRRLRIMEATARTGLGGVRTAWATAAANPTSYGVLETGPVAATWEDDRGVTGTGYPTLTMTMPARALIVWMARPIGLASAATYRSAAVTVRISFTPTVATYPTIARAVANGNALPVDVAVVGGAIKTFTAGTSYTLTMAATWNNDFPAAANLPTLTDAQFFVLPLAAS